MNDEDRIADLLHAEAETAYTPGPGGWEEIQRRINRRRTARRARRIAAPLLLAAAAAAVAVPLATGGGSTAGQKLHLVPPAATTPAVTTPPPTVPPASPTTRITTNTTAPPSTTTTVPLTGAAAALDAYLASDPNVAVHSGPVRDGAGVVAVAGVSTVAGPQQAVVQVLSWDGHRWSRVATVPVVDQGARWYFSAGQPVSVADVTGDGRPDFLLVIAGADNAPGVIVSEDGAGGGWRLVPTTGPYGSSVVVLARDPVFLHGRLVSYYNDCIPYCAAGHTSVVNWAYQRSSGIFVAVNPPTPPPTS